MRILQSTIEQLAWYVVGITLIAAVAIGATLYGSGRTIQNSIAQGQINRNLQTKSTQAYIKCIVLLRYTHPDLTDKSTKQQVEAALDDCAQETVK